MSNSSGPARLQAVVRGRVQGVGFRWWVLNQARGLKLVGRVSNRSDGTVLVMAEGDGNRLEELADRLHRGPRHARVIGVETEWSPPRNRWRRFAIDHH